MRARGRRLSRYRMGDSWRGCRGAGLHGTHQAADVIATAAAGAGRACACLCILHGAGVAADHGHGLQQGARRLLTAAVL